jgi:hypothetical protein
MGAVVSLTDVIARRKGCSTPRDVADAARAALGPEEAARLLRQFADVCHRATWLRLAAELDGTRAANPDAAARASSAGLTVLRGGAR